MMLYTNQSGTRWIDTNKANMKFVLVVQDDPNDWRDGVKRIRKASYFSSFGNFGTIGYRFRGRWYEGFPCAADGGETRSPDAKGMDALPHIFHKRSRCNSKKK